MRSLQLVSSRCVAALERSLMLPDSVAEQSLVPRTLERAIARFARARPATNSAPSPAATLGKVVMEACLRAPETILPRPPATRQRSEPLLRLKVPPRSPARTVVVLLDAERAAARVTSSSHARSVSSLQPSPPPNVRCCDDRLNSPSTPAGTSRTCSRNRALPAA